MIENTIFKIVTICSPINSKFSVGNQANILIYIILERTNPPRFQEEEMYVKRIPSNRFHQEYHLINLWICCEHRRQACHSLLTLLSFQQKQFYNSYIFPDKFTLRPLVNRWHSLHFWPSRNEFHKIKIW